MAEGEPPTGIPEGEKGAEKPFQPSFLLKEQKDLDAISNPELQKRVRVLHTAAVQGVLSSDQWRSEYLSIMNKTIGGEYDETESSEVLARIADHVKGEDEKQKKEREEELLEALHGEGERAVPIQAPEHIGAVFKGGAFYRMFKHETIPQLDIAEEADRNKFILENIHAFDYLLKHPGAWQAALEAWLSDSYFAARANKLGPEVEQGFIDKLKAMMAVTTSARCMEKSNGSMEEYGVWLTTGGQGKEADLDIQDQLKDKILHEDAKKIRIVLDDWQVRHYHERLLDDMGVRYNRSLDSIKRDKQEDKNLEEYYSSRKIIYQKNTKDIREGGSKCELTDYLKDSGKRDGFAGYIKEVLLKGENPDSADWDAKWAAARLACDIVMVDGTYTLWESHITNGRDGEKAKGWNELKLFPIKNWGGDPLRSLLEPSYLPNKIKHVYQGDLGEEIMKDLDGAFAPQELVDRGLELKPTMIQNWKKLARWGRAHWIVLGGSQAEKLSEWPRESKEELKQVALRLNEVYGGTTEKDERGNEIRVGKDIVGAMMARIFKTKAKAYAASMKKPGAFELADRTLGELKEHPNYEILSMLWGPKVDATSGLRVELAGPELELGFNNFGAREDLMTAKAVLQTGNPRARGGAAARAAGMVIGGVFRALGGTRGR